MCCQKGLHCRTGDDQTVGPPSKRLKTDISEFVLVAIKRSLAS